MPTTFISYRRDDAAGYAGRLYEALERRLGTDQIFRDIDTLEPGLDFIDAIESRLYECRVFLALIGREWLDARDREGHRRLDQSNDYVRLEIAAALARADVRVIPVLIEGATMPAPESLPEDLRQLSRRHAVHLRDDAWDHDVDRLASVISEITGTSLRHSAPVAARTTRETRNARWIVAAAAAVALVAIGAYWLSLREPSASSSITGGGVSSIGLGAGLSAGDRDTGRYGVVIPAISEVAHVSLIYTLLSASVTPRGNGTSELRLRIRFANNGQHAANAWDSSFRLAIGGDTLTPVSNLNEVVAGHSVKQGIVVFSIPSSATRAGLRIIEGSRVGELPLDFSDSTLPAADERADAGDVLSRAIAATLLAAPSQLMRANDVSVAVTRGTSRRFANVVRLRFTVKYSNAGRYSFGGATLRVTAGGQTLAPIEDPTVAVEGMSDKSVDVEFEVPPETGQAVLRASIREASAEMAFEVPQ